MFCYTTIAQIHNEEGSLRRSGRKSGFFGAALAKKKKKKVVSIYAAYANKWGGWVGRGSMRGFSGTQIHTVCIYEGNLEKLFLRLIETHCLVSVSIVSHRIFFESRNKCRTGTVCHNT